MTALLAILACVEFPFAVLGALGVVVAFRERRLRRRYRREADTHLAALRKSREARA